MTLEQITTLGLDLRFYTCGLISIVTQAELFGIESRECSQARLGLNELFREVYCNPLSRSCRLIQKKI